MEAGLVCNIMQDDTPGCTREACAFRDDKEVLKKAGAVVVGVSAQDEKSHIKFIKKYPILIVT